MNITNIITGWAKVLLDQLDLLNPEEKKNSVEKLVHCHNNCPMLRGGFCSKRVKAKVVVDFMYDNGSKKTIRKEGDYVKGCGCAVVAKSLTKEQCPRGCWEKEFMIKFKENSND